MGVLGWIWGNITEIGVIAGLVFTGLSYRKDEKSRQLGNFFAINESHREIWTEVYKRPDLERVLQKDVDLKGEQLREEETIFVNLLILHLNATYQAMRTGLFRTRQGIENDINSFFALPIPRAVWETSKHMREPDFVLFVERAMGRPIEAGIPKEQSAKRMSEKRR